MATLYQGHRHAGWLRPDPHDASASPVREGFLLDTHHADLYGGTGLAFDWGRVPQRGLDMPLILAGGLTPANVAEAITRVRPFGGGCERWRSRRRRV